MKESEINLPPVNMDLPCPKLADFCGDLSYKRCKDDLTPENDNVVFLNGVGRLNADIMFLTAAPLKEDVDARYSTPMHLKSGAGEMFRAICLQNGIDIDDCYFTSLIKYGIKQKNLKGCKKDIDYCLPLLLEEFQYCHPKIIVCVGTEACDFILNYKISVSKLEEAWFFSQEHNAHVFVISSIYNAYYKPELYDKLDKEIGMLADFYDHFLQGKPIEQIKCDYQCISTYSQLSNLLNTLKSEGYKLFGVDCEWGKQCFVDGYLRSIQFAWAPGQAAYINFNNEQAEWVFDAPKEAVCKLLQDFFNDPEVHFVGHNGAADAQWMSTHLGLNVYDGKFIFDTMFGIQTADEYADQKLEKLAAKYTDKGRYDIDLILWKKNNKGVSFDEDEGYGQVPLEILYPYGCSDADVTLRLYPIIKDMLIKDGTYDYFMNIKLPFVMDGFTSMSIAGVPFCTEDANKARIAYLAAGVVMQKLFMQMLKKEAYDLFYTEVSKIPQETPVANIAEIQKFFDDGRSFEDIFNLLKKLYGRKALPLLPFAEHYYYVDAFNPNSAEHKKKWLFDVKKYTPIKTTKPEEGNAIPWERVLKMSPAKQKNYKPAVDKDTLKIFADKGDDLCLHLLQMNAINQITKNFLKGEEGGLQKFLTSDGRLHSNFVMTESSRPRSFKPNILNIPRYVTDYIDKGFTKVLKYFNITDKSDLSEFNEENFNEIVNSLRETYGIVENITIKDMVPAPLRWCFKAPEGYCYVDADYATAEVWSIAYLANDKKLISTLNDPDPQFAFKKMPDGSEKQVRIAYCDDIVEFTEDAKDPALLVDPNDPDLVRNKDGSLKHPKQDVHWVAVENKFMLNTPREKLNKKKTRDAAGKVANFCSGKENYVYTLEGYKKAKLIKQGDTLKSISGFTKTLSVTALSERDCIKIRLSSGLVATYHKYHKLRCFNGTEMVWVRVKDIDPKRHKVVTLNPSFTEFIGIFNVPKDSYTDFYTELKCREGDNTYRLPEWIFSLSRAEIWSILQSFLELNPRVTDAVCYNFPLKAWKNNLEFISDIALLLNFIGFQTKLSLEQGEDVLVASAAIEPNSPLQNIYFSEVVSLEHVKEDIVAIECESHEYIDTSMNSHNSIPYGASPSLLERNIEIASGEKPEPGTGQKLIDAYMNTKPQVAEFLEWCKSLPDGQGYYQSPSGFKRHFKIPPLDAQMSDELRESIISKLRREACNIGLQSLVADSLARAIPPLNSSFRKMNMKSRVVIPLYDAIYILSPYNEVDLAVSMLKFFMSENNYWDLKGGRLRYSIDVEVTKRWGTEPSEEEHKELTEGLKNACQTFKLA